MLYGIAALNSKDDNTRFADYAETVGRMRENLKIAPISYNELTEKDKLENYYLVGCDECGWWGSSRPLNGGGAIGMTGDHFDCTCPVCGKEDPQELLAKDEVLCNIKESDDAALGLLSRCRKVMVALKATELKKEVDEFLKSNERQV